MPDGGAPAARYDYPPQDDAMSMATTIPTSNPNSSPGQRARPRALDPCRVLARRIRRIGQDHLDQAQKRLAPCKTHDLQ